MNYIYKVNVSGGRELYFREMTLKEYKNLQKICLETDLELFKVFVHNMISGLCSQECKDLNIIDIYNILLNIRMYSISDEKSFTTYIGGKSGIVKVNVEDIINKVIDVYCVYSDNNKYAKIDIEDFEIADSVLVDIFNDNQIKGFIKNDITYDDFDDNIDDFIPISVKKQIDNKTYGMVDSFSNIELFELINEEGDKNIITFDLNKNYVYDFCRAFLKEDLKSLYQDIYDMKMHLNIGLNEHEYMTLSEVGIYINLFNKDQEKQNQKDKSNGPLPT
jgi:hypothetical protein